MRRGRGDAAACHVAVRQYLWWYGGGGSARCDAGARPAAARCDGSARLLRDATAARRRGGCDVGEAAVGDR